MDPSVPLVIPNLLKQTRRAIKEISGDGAYDTRECHRAIRVKKAIPLILPHEGIAFWEKVIHVIRRLVAKSSMVRTKSGNESMVTIGVHCRGPLCIA